MRSKPTTAQLPAKLDDIPQFVSQLASPLDRTQSLDTSFSNKVIGKSQERDADAKTSYKDVEPEPLSQSTFGNNSFALNFPSFDQWEQRKVSPSRKPALFSPSADKVQKQPPARSFQPIKSASTSTLLSPNSQAVKSLSSALQIVSPKNMLLPTQFTAPPSNQTSTTDQLQVSTSTPTIVPVASAEKTPKFFTFDRVNPILRLPRSDSLPAHSSRIGHEQQPQIDDMVSFDSTAKSDMIEELSAPVTFFLPSPTSSRRSRPASSRPLTSVSITSRPQSALISPSMHSIQSSTISSPADSRVSTASLNEPKIDGIPLSIFNSAGLSGMIFQIHSSIACVIDVEYFDV
jgi:hypothetical protein